MNLVEIWSFELLISKGMTLVEHMQNSSPQDVSDWMLYHLGFLGSGHSVDSVLAMCAHLLDVHMYFMPKSIIFVHINIIEDNAFMWFPLAFQV